MTKIEYTLKAMGKVELRLFRFFLESPLFNTRTDVIRLYEWLGHNPLEPRQDTYAYVYPDTAFDGQKMRLVMSYLQQAAEQFLAFQQWQKTLAAPQCHLLRAVRERNLETHFNEALKTAKSALEKQALRNPDYYTTMGQVLWEEARFMSVRNPGDGHYLSALSQNADVLWATQKLRLFCLQRAQKNVYKSEGALPFREEVEAVVLRDALLSIPAVAIWYYCLKMLEAPQVLDYFNAFKQLLLAQDRQFDTEEIRDLHLFAINYCIKRANEGHGIFYQDIMDFYKDGLQKEYLLENGVLSRFTFHNIVGAGITIQEYDWVEQFISQYRTTLERTYREATYSFNLARLEFARKRYDVLLPLLQSANYHDPLISLAAKSMALKIYYETREYDLLESHLEAMKNYIRRKTTLGYHRTYYLNLVKYTQKLMALNWLDAQEVEKIRAKIGNETMLIGREWLLEQFGPHHGG